MIGAIIQARMGSSRLPGKVLSKIDGETLLEIQIDRISKAKSLNKIIIATTNLPMDDVINDFCNQHHIDCYRGDENDVLSRYYETAKSHSLSTIVRLTADCPLIDPDLIDQCVVEFLENKVDYFANTVPPKTSLFPDGSDVEVFSFESLERANKEATDILDREHVTFYFWKYGYKNGFSTGQLMNKEDFSKYRYTVDYPEDLEVVKLILEEMKKMKICGTTNEIVDILKNNEQIYNLNKKYYFGIGWK